MKGGHGRKRAWGGENKREEQGREVAPHAVDIDRSQVDMRLHVLAGHIRERLSCVCRRALARKD